MQAVGVDVGGTKIAAGVVTPEGKILDEVRYPTPHSPKTLVETIARAISEVGDGPRVGGVCLAVPGLIIALIGAHLYLVAKLGTTAPPWVKAEKKDLLTEEL